MNRREFVKTIVTFGKRLEAGLRKIALTEKTIEWPVGGGYRAPDEHGIILERWIDGQIIESLFVGEGCYVEFQPHCGW